VLFCGPFLATVTAGQAILATGDTAACADLLPGIAGGRRIATLAVTEADGRWEEDALRTRATRAGESWRLDGTKMFVLDGCST
ncbi:hypothetical protein MXD81_26320, partial [Microbacteriaceae bacterium K1510]|nr:hypothetical protein [Microbacteriaceae bacterium K1510]